jgi:4'-phosphopantetheinyl transferase
MTDMAGRTPMKVAEPLGDDEIHVWRLAYARAAGRAPLKAVLARYLGLEAEAVRLAEGEYGRPVLDAGHGPAPLDFNWSHSGDRALLAVARGIAPGIDLERLRPRPRALQIAERYFTPGEALALAGLGEAERDAAFLALWTAKEAVLKALGRGLAFGLHRLDIGFLGGGLALRRIEGDEAACWQLQALPLDDAHAAALAWRGGPRRIVPRSLAATAT